MNAVWTEGAGRRAVAQRAWGRCEMCAHNRGVEWAHRVARSHHGPWSPVNGLLLCTECHGWTHAHPQAAKVGGWIVPDWHDPVTRPVWLRRVDGTGWWQLQTRDGFHETRCLDERVIARLGLPAVPPLPPWIEVEGMWPAASSRTS